MTKAEALLEKTLCDGEASLYKCAWVWQDYASTSGNHYPRCGSYKVLKRITLKDRVYSLTVDHQGHIQIHYHDEVYDPRTKKHIKN